jgi:epoxide hydrolase-like predicted phosphatase
MAEKMKVVLFDIGGVILRTDNPGPRSRLARRYGLDREGIDRLVFANPAAQAAEVGQADEAAVWAHVRETLGLSESEMDSFRSEFWAGDGVDLSLLELMRLLRSHLQVGLLTNSWLTEPLDLFRTRFAVPEDDLREVVDGVISSARLGVQKPDRRIFDVALERFGVTPGEAVFIDDFARNVEAARALGIRAILFESPTQARRDLLVLLDLSGA